MTVAVFVTVEINSEYFNEVLRDGKILKKMFLKNVLLFKYLAI